MENLSIYNNLRRPPETALKQIQAGRLKGKSDINPQWRIEAMTREFGPCGIGWKYEVVNKWTLPAAEGQVFAFVDVHLFISQTENQWSDPIPGTGGSMLIELESRGLHCNDEAFKMALTDALSVAMKAIGMAGDIYAGAHDGSKYIRPLESDKPIQKLTPPPFMTPEKIRLLETLLSNSTVQDQDTMKKSFPKLDQDRYDKAVAFLQLNQNKKAV